MVRRGRRENRVSRVPQAPLVPPVVGWSTPGGGGPPTQTQEELNCCTKDWLLHGSHSTHKGGGADYLCLPKDPEYSAYQAGDYSHGNYLYGVEYDTWRPGPFHSVHNHNAPCAVCYTRVRDVVLMLPAKITCPPNWTLEYSGYLMSEWYNHYRTSYKCVDKDPESVPGSATNDNYVQFLLTEVNCGALPCPPYDSQKEVTCAVCTK